MIVSARDSVTEYNNATSQPSFIFPFSHLHSRTRTHTRTRTLSHSHTLACKLSFFLSTSLSLSLSLTHYRFICHSFRRSECCWVHVSDICLLSHSKGIKRNLLFSSMTDTHRFTNASHKLGYKNLDYFLIVVLY